MQSCRAFPFWHFPGAPTPADSHPAVTLSSSRRPYSATKVRRVPMRGVRAHGPAPRHGPPPSAVPPRSGWPTVVKRPTDPRWRRRRWWRRRRRRRRHRDSQSQARRVGPGGVRVVRPEVHAGSGRNPRADLQEDDGQPEEQDGDQHEPRRGAVSAQAPPQKGTPNVGPPSASGQGNGRAASRPTTSGRPARPARPASGGSGRPDTASSKAAWKQQHLELQQLIKGGRTKSPASKRPSSSSSLSSTPDERRRAAAAEAAAELRSSSAEVISSDGSKRPGSGSTRPRPSSGGINRMTNATYTKQQESRSALGRGTPSPSPPSTGGGSRQQQRRRSPVDTRGTPSPGGRKSVSWAPTDSEDGSGSPSPDASRWDQQRGKQTRGSPRDRYEVTPPTYTRTTTTTNYHRNHVAPGL